MSNKFKDLVIPEGWALVPSRFEVSGDVMSEICQMVASGGHSIEHFDKATFCVKSIQDDETGEMVHGLHLFNSECPEEGGSTVFEFEPLAVEPETAKLGAAFRLAAQIAGIKDEVADFMAGLDGALLAGKSIEALHDEIMERIALYDTPEAVDLFMNLVKTREAGLPDGLTPEAIELLKGLPFPHRRIAMVFDAPNLGDGYMVPEVVQAFNESHRRSDWGKYPFTASNDITINVINLSAGGSPGEIGIEPPLQHVNKTNQQGQIELLTAALDAARHECDLERNKLDGKYISATATVIDAYQLPLDKDVIAGSFVEWASGRGVKWSSGSPDCLQVYQTDGIELMEAYPGEWVTKCNTGVVHVFEPEVFATLYTSAAEFLK